MSRIGERRYLLVTFRRFSRLNLALPNLSDAELDASLTSSMSNSQESSSEEELNHWIEDML